MKITIHLGKEKTVREIPVSWGQLTFRQFVELSKCGEDYVKILSLFTGIPGEKIRDARIENLETIIHFLSFLKTKIPMEMPKKILGHDIPEDLGLRSIAQYEDLKDALRKTSEQDQINNFPLYCATYACDPYDWQDAEKLSEKFWDAPAGEVLAVGNFTLLKLTGLNLPIRNNYPIYVTLKRKLAQGFRDWRLRLVSIIRYIRWRITPNTKETSY